MIQVEVIKFNRTTNQPIAAKIMQLEDWKIFNKFTREYYYKAYQIGYSQYNLVYL